jgi:2Fe-2S ferredoxin
MPRIVFIEPSGSTSTVDCRDGDTVMKAAVDHGVAGILAECGGNCACATCHVYVDEAWVDALPSPDDIEQAMLDGALDRRRNSRLACQIVATAALDGLLVHVPSRQV